MRSVLASAKSELETTKKEPVNSGAVEEYFVGVVMLRSGIVDVVVDY